jgi:hypothetical protein
MSLATIFYCQASAGSNNGTTCGNCYAVHDATNGFNAAAKWGAGATQIGSDTVVHFCGTYTGTAGEQDVFFFQGSGTSGHPITLLFEPNAKLTSPVWGTFSGAPITNHQSFIVIDGGTNGIIENTDNGSSPLGHNQNTGAIYSDGSNVTIQNWHINNLCQHTLLTDTNVCGTSGSNPFAIQWAGSNNLIQNNVIHDVYGAIHMSQGTTDTNNEVKNNVITRMNWGISVALIGSSNSGTLKIHNNDISSAVNWDENANNAHHNCIFLFQGAGGAESGVTDIYSNYCHGDFGIHQTSHIFIDPNGGTVTNIRMYNNILDNTGSTNGPGNGFITGAGTSGGQIYNNTIFCNNHGFAGMKIDNTGTTIKNNIVSTCPVGISVNTGSSLTASDKNVLYNLTGSAGTFMFYNGTSYGSVAAWTAGTGFDVNSTIANPNLNTSSNPVFQLQAGSSAHNIGADLTSLGIIPLDSDYLLIARPNGLAWDAGAFQLGSSGGGSNIGVVQAFNALFF